MSGMENSEILTLAEIVDQAINTYLSGVHTCMPGIIVDYQPAKKTATVQPTVKLKYKSDEIVSMPLISSVPVIFPGSSDAVIHFPLAKGDGVLIVFSETSLENWIAAASGEVEPGDDRRYNLTDAFCIPGLFPPKNGGKTVTGTGMEILYKNNKINLTDSGIIELNGNTKQFVTWTELNTALQVFLGLLMAHVHTCTAPGSPSSPPTSPITLDIAAAKSIKVVLGDG